jgi:hypothetical protein
MTVEVRKDVIGKRHGGHGANAIRHAGPPVIPYGFLPGKNISQKGCKHSAARDAEVVFDGRAAPERLAYGNPDDTERAANTGAAFVGTNLLTAEAVASWPCLLDGTE